MSDKADRCLVTAGSNINTAICRHGDLSFLLQLLENQPPIL
jgi:hypothetical protein